MKRVLIAPLDWGLGHATRCIPVIRELKYQGCEVLIAGNGDAWTLLKKEFPESRFFSLPAYAPTYPLNGSMAWSMLRQLPHFVNTIRLEHRALERIVTEASVDCVISDNRYGCWSDHVPSVIITHQSNILMPKRFGALQGPVRSITKRLINRFGRAWVPDFPGDQSLAGELISFGEFNFKTSVDFIGALSRFEHVDYSDDPELDVLVILSGPEPQRTWFESIITPQLLASRLRFKVVRGLPSSNGAVEDDRFVNFLPASPLQTLISSASLIVARSGYSTVMDMQAMGKKVVFVPTPGQTEQEYLAGRIMDQGIAYAMRQEGFELEKALEASKQFSGFRPLRKNDLLRNAVRRLLGDQACS